MYNLELQYKAFQAIQVIKVGLLCRSCGHSNKVYIAGVAEGLRGSQMLTLRVTNEHGAIRWFHTDEPGHIAAGR